MMRQTPFTMLAGVTLFSVSSALAQTTGGGTGGSGAPGNPGPDPGGLAGSWTNFWWIAIIVVVLVLAAIWFSTRRRGRP